MIAKNQVDHFKDQEFAAKNIRKALYDLNLSDTLCSSFRMTSNKIFNRIAVKIEMVKESMIIFELYSTNRFRTIIWISTSFVQDAKIICRRVGIAATGFSFGIVFLLCAFNHWFLDNKIPVFMICKHYQNGLLKVQLQSFTKVERIPFISGSNEIGINTDRCEPLIFASQTVLEDTTLTLRLFYSFPICLELYTIIRPFWYFQRT